MTDRGRVSRVIEQPTSAMLLDEHGDDVRSRFAARLLRAPPPWTPGGRRGSGLDRVLEDWLQVFPGVG